MRNLKKYFIPHHENDYKPHSLRDKSILVLFTSVIVLEIFFLLQVMVIFDKTRFLASVLPAVLTTLTNEDRQANNVLPLKENELLKQAAEQKAKDMAEKGYFAHTSPEGKTPWYWLQQVGYSYARAGENLAVNFFESDDVEQAWMNSPSHRANIVREDFTEIGIGVARGKYEGRNTIFVAQFFGKPMVAITETANASSTPPKEIATAPKTQTVNTQTAPKPAVVAQAPITPVTPVESPTPIEVQVLGEEVKEVQPTVAEISAPSPVATFFEKTLTTPRQSVNNIYLTIALFILFAMGLAAFVRFEMKQPIMIARGFALVAVIAVLSLFNLQVTNIKTEVPSDITANVIEALQ